MTNDILWGNTAGSLGGDLYVEQGTGGVSTVTTTYSDIGDTYGNYNDDGTNINVDPLFVDSANNDFHLSSTSLLIDAGTNTGAPSNDFEGDARPYDGDGNGTSTVDIGADEFVPSECPSLPSDGIMDNGSQWTSFTGSWLVSGGANPYGGGSLYSNQSGAAYEYCASGVNGDKDVSLWWTWWGNRCTSVPVDIYDGSTLLDTVYVNHQDQAKTGQWNSLGTYTFSGMARVVINSQGGCTTCADAVKIASTGQTYQCSDGIDNDGDGLIDYPNDPGCSSATDNDEYNVQTTCPTIPSNGIIDNGDPGYTSSTGTWKPSSGANPYGGGSLYSNQSGAAYEYCASGVNGDKDVSLWWTYYSNRCTVVQVDIYDGNTNIDTVYVNQQANGGQWNSLGTYSFSGTARVVINSQGGCTTCVDACKIGGSPPPCPTLPSNGIMDNGSQWTTPTGSWLVSSGANPYGTGSLYSNTSGSYEYCASGVNGDKEVSLWWTYYSNRCTVVQVDIYDGNTNIDTVYVNQQANGGQWNSLGTYSFSGTARVVINSQGDCTTCADAVRIGGSPPPPPPPPTCPSLPSDGIMDNGSQWTTETGNWVPSSGANPYGGGSLYSNTTGSYEYCASGVNGDKDVSLWWTYWDNRCTVVQVDIYDGNTNIGTVNVNHKAKAGQWNSLGTYTFSGTAKVVIRSQGGCTTCADAVKIN